jgi:hypothetical protein
MKYLIALISLILASNLFAQKNSNFYKHMEGQISSNIYLVADLIRIDGKLDGTYYYYYDLADNSLRSNEKYYGKTMPINGSIDQDNNLEFKEFHLNGQGAMYQGKLISDDRIEGTWRNSDGSKKLPFELTEKYHLGSMPFNVYYLKETAGLFDEMDEPNAKLELTLLLPGHCSDGAIADSVRNHIIDNFFNKPSDSLTALQQMENEKELYFKHYRRSNEELYEGGMASFWEKKKSIKIHYNEADILSLEFFDYGYTGGAHGLPVSRFEVIDLNTGSQYTLDDLFRPDYRNDLRDIINSELRKMYMLDRNASLKEAGFFEHSVEPTNNFYINKDGIGFYYNRYEIAPFALGSTDVFIPFNKLQVILSANSPFSKISEIR